MVADPDSGVRERAALELLRRSPLVDGHNDLPWALREARLEVEDVDLSLPHPATHTDLTRLREGGVGAQFWSVYVPSTLTGDAAVAATLSQIYLVHRLVARYPHRLQLATTAAELEAAVGAGCIASLIGAEGGHSIDSSLSVLRDLHALGVRYLTLTHNDNVPWADSATDEPVLGGLSAFGREVVREMNRLGVLVDLSHVSTDVMRDALATSSAPVVFTHSSARGLVDHPRNVPDDVLTDLRRNGGVCMVTFVPDFVSRSCWEWSQALGAEVVARGADRWDPAARRAVAPDLPAKPRATIGDVADHVEHVRAVAGIDHVGIGGDYDGCEDMPEGLEDVSCYPRLFAELLRRGWSDEDCSAVAGRNVIRVLAEAEAVSESRA